MGGKAMQPTTSATNRLQPQHTYNIGHAHPITHLYPHTHTIVHTHMVGLWGRDWMTTVMTNTPWFDGNHSTNTIVVLNTLIQHITLAVFLVVHWLSMPRCAPPVAWKAWCCACHALPFHSFHSCPPICPSHTHSLCVIGSQSVPNTFTSERVTVHTHLCQEGDNVDGTQQTRHTG